MLIYDVPESEKIIPQKIFLIYLYFSIDFDDGKQLITKNHQIGFWAYLVILGDQLFSIIAIH